MFLEVDFLLEITAVCNAGLLLRSGESCILIDGIAESCFGFTGLSKELFKDLMSLRGLFSGLKAVLFTHTHPDHYDEDRVRVWKNLHPEIPVIVPDEKTPASGRILMDPFSVLYTETPHMPHTFTQVRHFTLLVQVEDESMYVAADAVLDAELHRALLQYVRPTYIAVNPVYLTMASTISWLADMNSRAILVYHVPTEAGDPSGMRRKAERSIGRCCGQLPPLLLPERFPSSLMIP